MVWHAVCFGDGAGWVVGASWWEQGGVLLSKRWTKPSAFWFFKISFKFSRKKIDLSYDEAFYDEHFRNGKR